MVWFKRKQQNQQAAPQELPFYALDEWRAKCAQIIEQAVRIADQDFDLSRRRAGANVLNHARELAALADKLAALGWDHEAKILQLLVRSNELTEESRAHYQWMTKVERCIHDFAATPSNDYAVCSRCGWQASRGL